MKDRNREEQGTVGKTLGIEDEGRRNKRDSRGERKQSREEKDRIQRKVREFFLFSFLAAFSSSPIEMPAGGTTTGKNNLN